MTSSLDHLPPEKQQELETIISTIKRLSKPVMIILFGSYARGDFVDRDVYQEANITYEYRSDYDILVIVKDEKAEKRYGVWNQISAELERAIDTPVSIIVDTIDYVNKQIQERRYFYIDIQREGIVLFDNGKYTLQTATELSPEIQRKIAQEDLDYWTKNAEGFVIDAHNSLVREDTNKAAFYLHQATESYLICTLLVCTGYRPKTHVIEKLLGKCLEHNPAFLDIFPKENDKDREVFRLLCKAYIDARYDKNYVMTKEQVEYLSERVRILESLTKEVCEGKIDKL